MVNFTDLSDYEELLQSEIIDEFEICANCQIQIPTNQAICANCETD